MPACFEQHLQPLPMPKFAIAFVWVRWKPQLLLFLFFKPSNAGFASGFANGFVTDIAEQTPPGPHDLHAAPTCRQLAVQAARQLPFCYDCCGIWDQAKRGPLRGKEVPLLTNHQGPYNHAKQNRVCVGATPCLGHCCLRDALPAWLQIMRCTRTNKVAILYACKS